jgi:hypothetical protein
MGGEIKGEVLSVSPLSHSTLNLQPSTAPAATFTTNALLTEADTSYDGQDIVIDGATVAIDGRHSSPCS